MEERYEVIPRNLSEPDQVIHLGGKGLSWKQIRYLVVGGMLAYGAFHLPLPITLKLVSSIVTLGTTTILATSRVRGQELDELVKNSLVYAQRRVYYSRLERVNNLEVQATARGYRVSLCTPEVPEGLKNLGV